MPENEYDAAMAEVQADIAGAMSEQQTDALVDDAAEDIADDPEIVSDEPTVTTNRYPTPDEIADVLQRRFAPEAADVDDLDDLEPEDVEGRSLQVLNRVHATYAEIDDACAKLEGLPEGFANHVKGWLREAKSADAFQKGSGTRLVDNAIGQAVRLGLYKAPQKPAKTVTSSGAPSKSVSTTQVTVPAGEALNVAKATRAFEGYMTADEVKGAFKP